jgi:2'-5' RNA ligase
MGYAVELYFDSQTEQAVRVLRQRLLEEGILPLLPGLDARPHLSLAVLPSAGAEQLVSAAQEHAAATPPLDSKLSAIGTFPTDENVLFLSPVRTAQLSECHRTFHDRLAQRGLAATPHYDPENWMPHCTVEMNIPEEQFLRAIETCKRHFRPLRGQLLELGVIEFRPLRRVGTWPLSGLQ